MIKGTVKYSGYNNIGPFTKRGMKNKRKRKVRLMRENEQRKQNLLLAKDNDYYQNSYNDDLD